MADPLEHAFNQIKQKIPSLIIIEQKSLSLLKVMVILFAISFMIIVIIEILHDDDDIVILPFETVGIGESWDGKSLATLLNFNLQKIKDTYEQVPEITDNSKSKMIIPRPLGEFSITNLSIKRTSHVPLEYSLPQIGTIGVGGAAISIDNLLLYMKEFLGNRANVITCSLQRYNSSMFVIAILEDSHSSKSDIMIFKDEVQVSKDEQVPILINDLAFMIALELHKRRDNDPYPQTWQTFKYLTEGRDAYNNYITMKNINYTNKITYLNKVRDTASLAIMSEPGYKASYELLSDLGFAYLEVEKYNEAAKIFKNITLVKPFESAIGLGLVYGKQSRYVEALNAFDYATQLNPRDADAWNYKGIILIKQGNYSEAIKAFNKTTHLDPRYATAWKYEGDALAQLGENNHSRYNEAIQAYDKATKLNPQYVDAWNNKGISLYNVGRYHESIRAFSKVIQTEPNNENTWIYKALALERLNKHEESVKAYQKALSIKKAETLISGGIHP